MTATMVNKLRHAWFDAQDVMCIARTILTMSIDTDDYEWLGYVADCENARRDCEAAHTAYENAFAEYEREMA